MRKKKIRKSISKAASIFLITCFAFAPGSLYAETEANPIATTESSAVSNVTATNQDKKAMLDEIVAEFNKSSQIRVSGLNNLDMYASDQEKEVFYNRALDEIKKKIDADAKGIKIEYVKKGTFRAAFYDGTKHQAADIPGNKVRFTISDDSYSIESQAFIIYDKKSDISISRDESKSVIGDKNTKETATYSVNIGDPGYATDRWNSAIAIRSDGEVIFKQIISPEYKLDSADFAKKIAGILSSADAITDKYSVSQTENNIVLKAKKEGKHNLSITYWNEYIDMDKIDTDKEKASKLDNATKRVDEGKYVVNGLEKLTEADLTDDKKKEILGNVLSQIRKQIKADAYGIKVHLDKDKEPVFELANDDNEARIRRIGIVLETKDGSKTKKYTTMAGPQDSLITIAKIDEKSSVGSPNTVDSATYKVIMPDPAKRNYTTTINFYEGDGCMYSGHASVHYKDTADKVAASIVDTLKKDKLFTKYYAVTANDAEVTFTAIEKGNHNIRFDFINNTNGEVPDAIHGIGSELKKLWEIKGAKELKNDKRMTDIFTKCRDEVLYKARTNLDFESLRPICVAMIQKTIAEINGVEPKVEPNPADIKNEQPINEVVKNINTPNNPTYGMNVKQSEKSQGMIPNTGDYKDVFLPLIILIVSLSTILTVLSIRRTNR